MKKLILVGMVSLGLVSGSVIAQDADIYDGWGTLDKVTINGKEQPCPSSTGKYYHDNMGNKLGACPAKPTQEDFVKEASWLIANYDWQDKGTRSYLAEGCTLVKARTQEYYYWSCKKLKALKDAKIEFTASNLKTVENTENNHPFSVDLLGAER